jgi:UV DNA damage endonuclease
MPSPIVSNIIPGLVCTLHSNAYKYRHATLASNPTQEKLSDIYTHNVTTLVGILNYCLEHNIGSYRVPTFLFPLANHPKYKGWAHKHCHDLLQAIDWSTYSQLWITNHPEQFLVLSSVNPQTVDNSIDEIHFWTQVCSPIPWSMLNLHIGSRSNHAENLRILHQSVARLDVSARNILSFENDEKSYPAQEVLHICQELELKMVLDFHHERCYQRYHQQGRVSNDDIDGSSYALLDDVAKTYTNMPPLFHISSPSEGWNMSFQQECKHAEYIATKDWPTQLNAWASQTNTTVIVDIEAKNKEDAIFKLRQENAL